MKPFFETPSCDTCKSRLDNVFCSLDDKQLKELNVEKACNFYKKGQLIFFEGNKPQGLYCINSGKVKIFQTGLEGKEQILRLAKDGDILGYRTLISGGSYSASAMAMEDCSICMVPKNIFFDLLQANSDLSTRVMELLSHDLKEAEHRITELAQKPVRERMAETILMLKEFYGLEHDNQTIDAMISRDDIANITGTATETAIRVLSDFKNEKLIDLKGKKIRILNTGMLLKAANIFD
jgi:CRP/FNR family transcriptional regulator